MLVVAVVQWLNRVWLFVTPWTAVHQSSLSFTISPNLLKLTSIESVMLKFGFYPEDNRELLQVLNRDLIRFAWKRTFKPLTTRTGKLLKICVGTKDSQGYWAYPGRVPRLRIIRRERVGNGQFSRSVMSDSLRPHGLQHTRPSCASPTPRVSSNSCPLSWWCHPTILSSVIPFSSRLIFPSIRVFSNESALCIRWPKYWSFSISPSNEYSGPISFRMDWLEFLAVQGLSRVFSNTTVQKHQFFGAQLSL